MSKHESCSPLAFGSLPESPPLERRGGSESVGRPPLIGEIGFVGLGHMGTAMAANLAAAGRRVIAYVRRPDQISKLETLGLRPTTDIGDLLDCELVISMLPDDDAVREVVFGRRDDALDGLACRCRADDSKHGSVGVRAAGLAPRSSSDRPSCSPAGHLYKIEPAIRLLRKLDRAAPHAPRRRRSGLELSRGGLRRWPLQ